MGIAYRHFGFLSFGGGDGIRFTWLQVSRQWGIKLELWNRDDEDGNGGKPILVLGLIFFCIYLNLPFRMAAPTPYQLGDTYGAYWGWEKHTRDSIVFCWRQKRWHLRMPWRWEWYRTSYLLPDGKSWAHEWADDNAHLRRLGQKPMDRWRHFYDMPKWQEKHEYEYLLRSGEVQVRTATIELREYERRRWCLWWTRLFAQVTQTIEIRFSDEVGERTGSWKGGCTGCSYGVRDGERPAAALKRMEQERKF